MSQPNMLSLLVAFVQACSYVDWSYSAPSEPGGWRPKLLSSCLLPYPYSLRPKARYVQQEVQSEICSIFTICVDSAGLSFEAFGVES